MSTKADRAFEDAARRVRAAYPPKVAEHIVKYLGHDPDLDRPIVINACVAALLDYIDDLRAELAQARAEKGVPLATATV